MAKVLEFIGAIVLSIILVIAAWHITAVILYVHDMILIAKAERMRKKSETEDNNRK